MTISKCTLKHSTLDLNINKAIQQNKQQIIKSNSNHTKRQNFGDEVKIFVAPFNRKITTDYQNHLKFIKKKNPTNNDFNTAKQICSLITLI